MLLSRPHLRFFDMHVSEPGDRITQRLSILTTFKARSTNALGKGNRGQKKGNNYLRRVDTPAGMLARCHSSSSFTRDWSCISASNVSSWSPVSTTPFIFSYNFLSPCNISNASSLTWQRHPAAIFRSTQSPDPSGCSFWRMTLIPWTAGFKAALLSHHSTRRCDMRHCHTPGGSQMNAIFASGLM